MKTYLTPTTNERLLLITLFCLGLGLSILLCYLYFDFTYFEPDTVSYLFQAKLFASGRICAEAPPEFGFSSSPHINILNGKWYSKYPFGNALMLTLGEFVNAPWLVPALATGLAVILLYFIVKETYDRRVALLAAGLGLISPATLGMGSTWFSEPVSRLYLGVFLFAFIKTLKDGGLFYPIISGFALGYAFNTRAIPAGAFGVSGAVFALYWALRSQNKIRLLKSALIFLFLFAIMFVLCMSWNYYLTGHPLKFTHNAMQPYDKLGFGKRTEGYEPDLERAFVFTPQWAFERLWRHVIPCVSFNTLGWGYYRPNLFRTFHNYTDSIVAGIVAKGPKEEDWITLKLWGHGDGTAQIQYQTRGNETREGLTGRAPGFSPSGGRTEITMRLVKGGDEYTSFFKKDGTWVKAGSTTINLSPPLEVGLYAGVCSPSGNMTVDVDYFRANMDSNGILFSDDFDESSLKRGWRWSKEPKVWNVGRTKSGWLHIKADTNSNLYTADTVTKLYQTTDSDKFDVEVRFVANWRNGEPLLLLRVIPLAFPLILMLIPLFHPSRNRYDSLFLGIFFATLFWYFFFYFEGSTWGITPVNARYYTECALLAIIPLVARGMFILYEWSRALGKNPKLTVQILLIPLIIALVFNTVHTYILMATPYRNWSAVYQKLPGLVKRANIHNAVVFIPHHRGAPIGDYPFVSLEKADIVYFKTGPSKVWKLTSSDWRAVYEKYFKGRKAYMYEGGKLNPLN